MATVEGARLDRISDPASLEVVADVVARLPSRNRCRHGAPIVCGVFDGDVPRALGRAVPVDPWASRVAHPRRLHPSNGLVILGWYVDVVVGRGDAHRGANIFLMIHRKRVGDHPAEAESRGEDTRGVDAKVLFHEGERVIE